MIVVRIRSWLLIVLFLATGALAVPPQAVHAEDIPESITLSPTNRKYHVDPGQTVTDTMTVINDGKTSYDLLVYARPYSVNDQTYTPNFTATPTNADAYKWIQFSKARYHLAPGASQKIEFTMNVPPQANAGGHYGVIFAETQPIETAQETSVIRKKRVGMIIYATIGGNYKSEGEPVSSNIPFWQLQPPLHTTITAKNTGNADFDDALQLTVKDMFGNVKYQEAKQYTLLPQTTRIMDLDWKDAPWFGLYRVETQQKVLGRSAYYSGYVLMLPRFLPIAVILICIIGGIYVWYRRRK